MQPPTRNLIAYKPSVPSSFEEMPDKPSVPPNYSSLGIQACSAAKLLVPRHTSLQCRKTTPPVQCTRPTPARRPLQDDRSAVSAHASVTYASVPRPPPVQCTRPSPARGRLQHDRSAVSAYASVTYASVPRPPPVQCTRPLQHDTLIIQVRFEFLLICLLLYHVPRVWSAFLCLYTMNSNLNYSRVSIRALLRSETSSAAGPDQG